VKRIVFAGQRLFMKYPELGYFRDRLAEVDGTLEELRDESQRALEAAVRHADAVVLLARRLDRAAIQAMERCRLILLLSVGYDCVDLTAATERLIPVSNTPAYCTEEVATHALALLLAVARKLPLIMPKTRAGYWDYNFTRPLYSLRGRMLGIIGLGRVGRALVPKARALGLRLGAYDPYVHDDIFALTGVQPFYELEQLLREADYLSIHAPLTAETHRMIDAAALGLMKPAALLINTARGQIVDEAALAEALRNGRLGGAGIDVLETEPPAPDNPLLALENVLVTPHVAWYTEESHEADRVQAMDELLRALQGKRPRWAVNPEVFGLRRSGRTAP
jgi:D-3-phosphoglycerate dehydrogenase